MPKTSKPRPIPPAVRKAADALLSDIDALRGTQDPNARDAYFGAFAEYETDDDGHVLVEWPNLAISAAQLQTALAGTAPVPPDPREETAALIQGAIGVLNDPSLTDHGNREGCMALLQTALNLLAGRMADPAPDFVADFVGIHAFTHDGDGGWTACEPDDPTVTGWSVYTHLVKDDEFTESVDECDFATHADAERCAHARAERLQIPVEVY